MSEIQRSQIQPVNFRRRFEMRAADAPSGREFCVFDFPGYEACPNAQHTVQRVRSSEDPMKSEVWHAWIASIRPPQAFHSTQGG
jgi:hypothetical protein